MKKFTFIALLATLLCGCAQFADEELNTQKIVAPESIEASFEEPSSRTYVENDKYLRWTAGDEISYFPGVTFNMEYRFTGATGANNGSFSKVTVGPVTGNELSRNYAIYPYDEDIAVSDEGVISLNLPAVQKYAENSFGVGANTMVAATNGTNDEVLKFRNVGGYLKIKLYGDDVTVKSVKLQGNNNEKIAGPALITATYGNDPTVVMTAEATTSVTIDCEEGVTISDNSETPTEFWFVLPTVTFEDGFTITVTDINDGTFVKSTSNTFTIDRNMIQPMKELNAVIVPYGPANNEIWYTTTDGKYTGVTLYKYDRPNSEDHTIPYITSNQYDESKNYWVVTFNKDLTSIPSQLFSQKYTLTEVIIPSSIVEIESNAFYYCNKLEQIILPDGIKLIGGAAFQNCTSLTNITFPESVTSIGGAAFDNSGLEGHLDLSMVEDNIGGSAFYGSKIISVDINSATIGDRAFSTCTNLKTVTLGENVTSFHDWGGTLWGCNSIQTIYCMPTEPPSISIYENGSDCDFPWKGLDYIIYVPRSSYDKYTQYTTTRPNYAAKQNWSFYKDRIEPYDF